MPVLERRRGLRVVADAAALDGARWTGDDVLVLRLAPDEALALGATAVDLDDQHAIVESEAGFAAGAVDLASVAAAHRVGAADRTTGPRPGRDRGRAGQAVADRRRRHARAHAAYAADLQDRLR